MNEQYNRLAIEAAGVTIDELNSILEFQINSNHKIVVKQCNHVTQDVQNVNGYRSGRFNLSYEEHRALKIHNGLYLFIVHHDHLFTNMRLIPAKELTYSRLVAWPTVWSWTEPENIEGDIVLWGAKARQLFVSEEDHKHGL